MRHLRAPLLATLVAALIAACGDSSGEVVTGTGGAGGACLAGDPDCADIPTGTGGPQSRPDGSLWLSDALDAGVEGPFLVAAYYVDDGQGARLCAGILESFPPQCGEPSLRLGEAAAIDDTALTAEGGVTWSVEPVTVEGEITGDTFVPR